MANGMPSDLPRRPTAAGRARSGAGTTESDMYGAEGRGVTLVASVVHSGSRSKHTPALRPSDEPSAAPREGEGHSRAAVVRRSEFRSDQAGAGASPPAGSPLSSGAPQVEFVARRVVAMPPLILPPPTDAASTIQAADNALYGPRRAEVDPPRPKAASRGRDTDASKARGGVVSAAPAFFASNRSRLGDKVRSHELIMPIPTRAPLGIESAEPKEASATKISSDAMDVDAGVYLGLDDLRDLAEYLFKREADKRMASTRWSFMELWAKRVGLLGAPEAWGSGSRGEEYACVCRRVIEAREAAADNSASILPHAAS